ncbi:ABC transporter permease [Vallitalea okinawensis]|uniref:ABC transporter permease n=1 Tax=Vallitalea okinawensis TaxID=2078660 RepID=UPI000CFB7973|nr:ABC transporter permease subunit [Vallitalea okinawensis]
MEAISNKKSWVRFKEQCTLQAFALAGMLFLFIFSYIPMFGLIMGFKDYKISMGIAGIFTSDWVGAKYFIEFFTDYNFVRIMRNTFALSILKLVFTFPVPILLAVMLNEVGHKTFKKVVQTASYLPYFISWAVVAVLCMTFFSEQTGLVNDVLMKNGLVEEPVNILASSKTFWPLIVFLSIWKETGWWTIIFLAAIAGVDVAQYEAAQVDGANRLQKIWHITLPSIKPTIIVVLILSLGGMIGTGTGGSTFEQCYLLGNPSNIDTSEVIQTYVFEMGLSQGRYAYATAVGLIQSLISVTLVFLSNLIAKRVTGTGIF